MRAIGLDFEARRLSEFALPEPDVVGPGEVLLEVREVGLCGTDRELAEFHFGKPPDGERHLALGHEALAEVVAVGSGVRLRKGALVSPLVRRPCPAQCLACAHDRRDLCLTGDYVERGITGLHGYLRKFAVDSESDLLEVPAELIDVAVLTEPLSVVEKAISTAERIHVLGPRSALIVGAGPVGLLGALASLARGWRTEVYSLEPPGHPNARLAALAGARYSNDKPRELADVVLECSGAEAGARLALDWLAPLGVAVLIGATDFDVRFPGLRAVMQNQTVTGVVNASPEHSAKAIRDLARFDQQVLRGMIERRPVSQWREALTGPGGKAAKMVLAL